MTLYPFQRHGVNFLTGTDVALLDPRRAYLADEMGLGKTVQAIVAARQLLWPASRVLVVAPASVLGNWKREWREWAADEGPRTPQFVSYTQLTSHLGRYRAYYARKDWDLVILDEAHYCKSISATRTHRALRLARDAGRGWLLSGTPMPNHPGELFAPIRVLWPDVTDELGLDTYRAWRSHFCKYRRTRYGVSVYGQKNAGDLRAYLPQIMLRRKLGDVALELPPLRVDLHTLPRQFEVGQALEEAGLGDVTAREMEARMDLEEADPDGSLSRARRLLGTLKAPGVAARLAEELGQQEYEKIVVLYYHHDTGAVLRRALEAFGPVGFDGQTPQGQRQKAIDAFWNDPTAKVFLAQQSAAGVGINLQCASEIVLVEPAWSPSENAQAIKRVRRIGQAHPCRARIFSVEGTLDEPIMEVVTRKLRMQSEYGLEDGDLA